jgi:hypothetical protein
LLTPLKVKVMSDSDETVPPSEIGIRSGLLAVRPEPEVWPAISREPCAKDLVSVCVGSEAGTDRVTFWLACEPVVTMFSSASTIDTETFEPKIRSLSAVVGAEITRLLAAP